MLRWEYYEAQDPDEDEVARLGDEGWELVSVVEASDETWWYFFKRPKDSLTVG